jgi:hypothetical protein
VCWMYLYFIADMRTKSTDLKNPICCWTMYVGTFRRRRNISGSRNQSMLRHIHIVSYILLLSIQYVVW